MKRQNYQIIFATGNQGKIREIREIIAESACAGSESQPQVPSGDSIRADDQPARIEVLSMKEAGVPADPEENGKTFEDNALIKARAVYDLVRSRPLPPDTSRIVMSDDSGLEIDALGKAPGVYSARYMGYDTDYRLRMEHLLEELRDVPDQDRTARFVAAVAAILPDGSSMTVRGTMEGRIGHRISGENGFGYDPFFYPDGYAITSADMSPEEKNRISHRGKALREILARLGILCVS